MPDHYQGLILEALTRREPSRRATACLVWARDDERADPIFGFDMIITDRYARAHLGTDSASEMQATGLALASAHGLIDTERWAPAEEPAEVVRTADWDASHNDEGRADDDITRMLLVAFARMDRISGLVDYAPRLDVAGFADVLGVPSTRIRGLLTEMTTRGWIEPHGYKKRPQDGNARITREGYAAQRDRSMQPQEPHIGAMVREVETYLQTEDFSERFPKAWNSWSHALNLLSERPVRSGIIGYACREAMQLFAAELMAIHHVSTPPPSSQVTERIQMVARRDQVGEKTAAFFDALVNYWSRTFDLTQRLAKEALREKESAAEDDARRVVLNTALVMYEVARIPPPLRA